MLKITAIVATFALCAFTISSTLAQDKPASAPPAQPPASPPTTTDKPAAPSQKEPTPTIADGQALIQAEEYDKAAELFHKIVKAEPDNARAWHFLGYSLHAAGNLTDALPCHLMAAEFEQSAAVASYNAACVYSLRKKADKAFAWLEKAKTAGFDNVEQIEGDTDMENIRSDPRFAKFVESLKNAGGGQEPAPGGDGRTVKEERVP